jgi:PAS domain S-box-containing protein
MKKNNVNSDQALTLRQQAEQKLLHHDSLTPAEATGLSLEEKDCTLHNLQVHQIELEMQNEELIGSQVELETMRSRYFDLYDLAPVGYLALSEAGLVLEANLTAATLFGQARNRLVRQPITQYILKEDQDIFYIHYKRLYENREPQEFELRMVKSDGKVFWANLVATGPQTVEGEAMSRVVVSDITKRKRAEMATQEGQRFLANLLEAMPIPIFYKDQTGRFLGFNKAFEELYGISREELIGKTVFDIDTPEQARMIHEKDHVLLQQTGQQKYESKMADANGVLRDVIIHKASTHDAKGNVTGLIGAVFDISVYKKA